MKTSARRRLTAGLWVVCAMACSGAAGLAQQTRIESLSHNGVLTWTNSSLNATCRIEWASAAEGPWHGSWDSLTNLVVTNVTMSAAVPMFYRVVSQAPAAPWLSNVTASAALTLVTNNVNNTNFAVVDVRTASEYQPRHIKGALNLDFYSAAFQDNLRQLDVHRTYLVYCASGNRSGQATQIMKNLGFTRIYNMTQGFSSFAALPGAAPFLEP